MRAILALAVVCFVIGCVGAVVSESVVPKLLWPPAPCKTGSL